MLTDGTSHSALLADYAASVSRREFAHSLYWVLGQRIVARRDDSPSDDEPPPDTVLTRQIETIDNDRALHLIPGSGLLVP